MYARRPTAAASSAAVPSVVDVPVVGGGFARVDIAALFAAMGRTPLKVAPQGQSVTIAAATQAFIRHHAEWSAETVRWSRTQLECFASFDQHRCIRELDVEYLRRWLGGIAHLALRTQQTRWACIAAFLEWSARRSYIDASPAAYIDRSEKPWLMHHGDMGAGKPQLRNSDECRKYLRAANAWLLPEYRVATALPLLVGMRAGEVMALRRCDVDVGLMCLWIRGKRHRTDGWDVKRARSERRVVLPQQLLQDLQELALGDDAESRLIPGQWTLERHRTSWLCKQVQATCQKAQVRVVPTHGLRGTWSSICTEAGAKLPDIAHYLGHADSGQTAHDRYIGANLPDPVLPIV